jgi:fatty-acid desaturase
MRDQVYNPHKTNKSGIFWSQIVWFFYEKSKGKKTKGHLIFEEI